MTVSRSTTLVLASMAAAAIVAGCSGGSSLSNAGLGQNVAQGVAPPSMVRTHRFNARPDRSQSWMSPAAKKADLLYVSDEGTNDVDVFTYPAGKPVGVLTGFSTPQGLCVDAAQNVYVTDFSPPLIYKYAHGGTTPIATLNDPGEYLNDCAVDTKSGNLAVTNLRNASEGPGSVSVFTNASGTPTIYSNPNVLITLDSVTYDNHSNLYINGFDPNGNPALARLRKGASNFAAISVDQPIGYPGGLQWDGQNLAYGDESTPVVYQMQIHDSKTTTVGTTPLADSNEVFEFFIVRPHRNSKQGNALVAASIYPPSVSIYPYPAGGAATKTLTGFALPLGTAVSKGR